MHFLIADFDDLGTALDAAAMDIVGTMSEQADVLIADQIESYKDTLRADLESQGLSEVEIELTLQELDNIDVEGLMEQIDVEEILTEAETQCEADPNMEGCEMLSGLQLSGSDQFQEFETMIGGFDKYTVTARIWGIILFLLGGGLLFLINKPQWFYAAYRVGLSGAVSSTAMFIVYYMLPGMIDKVLSNKELLFSLLPGDANVDPSLLDNLIGIIKDVIIGWFANPVSKVKILCIVLMVIFIPMAVTFFILNRKYQPKGLNKSSKGGK